MVMGPGCVKTDLAFHIHEKKMYTDFENILLFLLHVHVFSLLTYMYIWCIFIMCCHSKYFAVKNVLSFHTLIIIQHLVFQYTYSSCHCHRKCSRCIHQLKYKVYNLFHILHVHVYMNNITILHLKLNTKNTMKICIHKQKRFWHHCVLCL